MIPVLAIELAFTILSAMNIFLTYMKIRRGLSKSILNIQSSLLRTIPPIAKCHVPYKSVLFLEADGWEPSGSLMALRQFRVLHGVDLKVLLFVSMVLNLLLSLRCLLLDVKEGMRPRPSLCVGIMCYWSVFIRVSFYVLGPHLSEWPLRPHR